MPSKPSRDGATTPVDPMMISPSHDAVDADPPFDHGQQRDSGILRPDADRDCSSSGSDLGNRRLWRLIRRFSQESSQNRRRGPRDRSWLHERDQPAFSAGRVGLNRGPAGCAVKKSELGGVDSTQTGAADRTIARSPRHSVPGARGGSVVGDRAHRRHRAVVTRGSRQRGPPRLNDVDGSAITILPAPGERCQRHCWGSHLRRPPQQKTDPPNGVAPGWRSRLVSEPLSG